MAEKKFFWLKLEKDFFRSKTIKRLRKQAGGDTYTIIVMELQLQAIGSNGLIKLEGIESPEEELALEIDENPDNVKVVLNYLFRVGWAEILDEKTLFFPCAIERTGSETQAAERMRQMRNRNNVTQSRNDVTTALLDRSKNVTLEKRRDREEIETDNNYAQSFTDAKPTQKKKTRKSKIPPDIEEVRAYCQERQNGVDANVWFDFYSSKGWMVGKNKMVDWKAAIRTWERNGRKENGNGTGNTPERFAEYEI